MSIAAEFWKMSKMSASLLLTLLLGLLVLNGNCLDEEKKIHIVYMGDMPRGAIPASSVHHSILESVLASSASAEKSLLYSYSRSFSGFAARLSDEEASIIKEMDGVVSVFPNAKLSLHTTRSWDFTGLPRGNKAWRSPQEGDVIVGLLDTGIWPESASFSDKGMGPPPAKWNGTCQGLNFTCNNKIIGARYYNIYNSNETTDFQSPRDSLGHGSHTSSTVAGVEVSDTSYYGLAKGTARGAVPKARIAMYKVCWEDGCSSADILAAMDDAIADGVDIMSISLGGPPRPFFEDPIAIGSFHAMKHGILTANSGGNSGPDPMSVANVAPWTVTVAASSIDRKFIAKVVLGNGQSFIGSSINSFALDDVYQLIYGGAAPNISAGASKEISGFCIPGALNSNLVKGTIVLCDGLHDGSGILMANGAGTIMASNDDLDLAFSYPLPATLISVDEGKQILKYIQSSSNPIATILHGETSDDVMAPTVVSFSSRGPNILTPGILKPDLTAPGVDILAAWSPVAGPSIYYKDKRAVNYNVISGTSMSCPHVAGVAAYVKSAHPYWSPAAIKSALMTTAYPMDASKNEDAEFAYGAGHINPSKALNPGLIFDATEKDYTNFLCSQGYNTTTLRLVSGDSSTCSNTTVGSTAWDLNYPSFSLAIRDGEQIWGSFPRTVTNVGAPNSTYHATIFAPSTLVVTVSPPVLSFSSIGEKKSFVVEVKGGVISQQPIISSHIAWRDLNHVVRTPLVVYTVLPSTNPMFTDHVSSFQFKGSSGYHKNGILG